MTQKVVLAMSVSLDGIAGGRTEEQFWAVHEAVLGWQFSAASWRASQGMDGGEEGVDSQVWQSQFDRFGAQVIGRRMFDYGVEHWGEEPPFRAPVFINTHRPSAAVAKAGGTTYTFVTSGIADTVSSARHAAGSRDVLVAGGIETGRSVLAAGLVDEVVLHVAPVVLREGIPLFDPARESMAFSPRDAVAGENALHLTLSRA